MKALIVDETTHVAERLGPALRDEGYGIDTAHARGEALWLAGGGDVDVVIVCANRPGGTDLETIAALRDDGELAPILVMARRDDTGATIAALDAGADDVVCSPVAFGEVAARLRALRRRPHRLEPQALTLGTLHLDPGTLSAVRTMREGATSVMLHRREFAVLEALMRRPGQVVSRARLGDDVWGLGEEPASNVVDQIISRLRGKIDRPFGLRDIETVRGVGYRIVDSAAALPRSA